MAYRFGSDYLIEIQKESAYGTAADFTGSAVVLADSIDLKPSREAIQIQLKTGKREGRAGEVLAGREAGKVVIKGDLSEAHDFLWQALFSTSASPYTVQDGHVPNSYTIRQYFITDKKGHQAIGCVLESLKLTGEGNKPMQYEATWRARSITSEEDFTTDGGGTVSATLAKPFLFADLADIVALKNGYTDLNSLTVTLSNEFADDAALYQTSFMKQRELLTGFSGEVSFEALYDTMAANSAGWLESLLLADDIKLGEIQFRLVGPTKTWLCTAYGKLSEVSPADPERQLFVMSASLKLLGSDTEPGIQIAIANR